ncbi:MAG TPA: flagellar hook-associated protein FlgL [Bacillota bacterium]|jgi:flagellar hook-associated protein 3 FlgL|nr:flagellar hook-associated protein FlgL [Bacillota bacterium]
MRVTNNMLISNMMRNLNSSLKRMQRVHNQMSSGKRFSMPSEDPVGVARSLKLRADINENRQFKKNAEDALSWLETTETALMQIKEVLQRARELAVQGANGVLSPEDCQKIAEEVVQLRDQLVSLGNSTYAGKHIFAGYKTNQAPVGLNPDGSLNYAGDLGQIMYQVGVSDILQGNMTAREIFEPGGKDLFADMQDFIDALNIGDSGTVGGIIGDIDVHMENILAKVAETGAKVNRMKLVVNRLEDDYLNFNKLLSQNEDADMAEVITRLKSEENVYMAALAGGARIIQPTLVDFLR